MTSPVVIPARLHSLWVFFMLAFGISWSVWIPTALASHELVDLTLDATISGLVGAFGPFCAMLITSSLFDGRAGLQMLWARLITWRVGLRWYAFALAWPVVLSLAKTLVAMLLGSQAPDFAQPPFVQLYPLPPELMASVPFVAFIPVVFLQQMLLGSSMGEEPGWRGYALPRLQSRYSSLVASLLLGFLWAVWHLPLWLTKGHPMAATFWGWPALGLMATAVLFTWLFNHTRGSLLLALLLHSSIAMTGLFLASAETHPLVEVALIWAVAIGVILRCGPEHLVRAADGAEEFTRDRPRLGS